jgi:hypothetical protein
LLDTYVYNKTLNITLNPKNFVQTCKLSPSFAYDVSIPVNASKPIFSPKLAIGSLISNYLRCHNFTIDAIKSDGFETLLNPVWSVTVLPKMVNQTIIENNRTTTVVMPSTNYTSDLKSLTNFLNLAVKNAKQSLQIPTIVTQLLTEEI